VLTGVDSFSEVADGGDRDLATWAAVDERRDLDTVAVGPGRGDSMLAAVQEVSSRSCSYVLARMMYVPDAIVKP
jgi:hypothetical protein